MNSMLAFLAATILLVVVAIVVVVAPSIDAKLIQAGTLIGLALIAYGHIRP